MSFVAEKLYLELKNEGFASKARNFFFVSSDWPHFTLIKEGRSEEAALYTISI
jgi:hypothetical protein